MSGKALISIVVLVIAVTLGLSSVYLVDQREKAIIFQFGEIVRSNDSPGLHFKAPLLITSGILTLACRPWIPIPSYT